MSSRLPHLHSYGTKWKSNKPFHHISHIWLETMWFPYPPQYWFNLLWPADSDNPTSDGSWLRVTFNVMSLWHTGVTSMKVWGRKPVKLWMCSFKWKHLFVSVLKTLWQIRSSIQSAGILLIYHVRMPSWGFACLQILFWLNSALIELIEENLKLSMHKYVPRLR